MRVVAVGDVILASGQLRERMDGAVLDILMEADVAFANAEFVCADRATPVAALAEHSSVCVEPWVLDEMSSIGVNLISVANNHIADFGAQGVIDTLAAIESRGIVYAGAGYSLDHARAAGFVEGAGGRLGLVAACSSSAHEMLGSRSAFGVAARAGLNPLRFQKSYVLAPDQYEALWEIDSRLGTASARDEVNRLGLFGGFAELARSDSFRFGGVTIREGETTHVETVADPRDLDALCQGVTDARRRADHVVVSLHCHEGENDGWNSSVAASFVEQAAHRIVEAGAAAVFGHGPHMLRGVEFYQGAPIFYSLGNFMFDRYMIERIPAEEIERYGLMANTSPADVHDFLSRGDDGSARGFYADRQYWEGCVATCELGDDAIEVRLAPVYLPSLDGPRSGRGIPQLAVGERGERIIERVRKLSSSYGTWFGPTDASGMVRVGAHNPDAQDVQRRLE